MKILLDSRKLIIAVNNEITFGTFECEEKWKVGSLFFIDDNFEEVEIQELSIDVVPQKYFYIDNTFVLNPNWNNTSEDIQEVNNRINEVLLKKAESELDIDERLSKLELGLL